jgi:hypothetical protein
MSNETGPFAVYVRPFPGPGGKWQVSTGVGVVPKWSHNGKELFYSTADYKIMVVGYTASGNSFQAEKPRLWSPGQFTARGGWEALRGPEGSRDGEPARGKQGQLHLQFLRRVAPQSPDRQRLRWSEIVSSGIALLEQKMVSDSDLRTSLWLNRHASANIACLMFVV